MLLGQVRGWFLGIRAGGRDRAPGPLQRAVHRHHGGVQQIGHLGGLPAEHLAQNQDRALPGRQMLQRGDERQPDGVVQDHLTSRVGVRGGHRRVTGDRLDPGGLRQGGYRGRGRGHRRGQVHRQRAALPTAQHVQADVGGDAVQPGAHRGTALEPVERPPGPHHGLLHGVVRVMSRAQHSVAVAGQFRPVHLQVIANSAGGCDGSHAPPVLIPNLPTRACPWRTADWPHCATGHRHFRAKGARRRLD